MFTKILSEPMTQTCGQVPIIIPVNRS